MTGFLEVGGTRHDRDVDGYPNIPYYCNSYITHHLLSGAAEMAQQGMCETDNAKLFLLKWALVGLNVLFWAMGVTAFALGMWLYIENNEYAIFSDGEYLPGSVLLLACGFAVIIMGFLGIVGALFESKMMAFTYMALLIMAMILYLSAGIWAVVNNDEDELREDIDRFLSASLDDYSSDDDFREAWDDLQRRFQCCGTFNSSSWSFTFDFTSNFSDIPSSCCVVSPCTTSLLSSELYSMV